MKRDSRVVKGFTLVEIIVGMTVVSVILLGIITVSLSLQRTSRNSSNSYFISFSAQSILNQMLQDAQKSVGTVSYPGFLIGTGSTGSLPAGGWIFPAGTGDANTTCFYQQNVGVTIDEMINNGGNIPSYLVPPPTPTPPFWSCYTYPAAGSHGDVYYCQNSFVNDSAVNYGASACSPASTGYLRSLGKVKALTPSFSMVSTQSGTQRIRFDMEIQSCLDPASGCASGNANNPYVIKKGSVFPSAQSAG